MYADSHIYTKWRTSIHVIYICHAIHLYPFCLGADTHITAKSLVRKESNICVNVSPAHTDSLITTITTKVTDIRRGSTTYSVGYATPTSFTSRLHGFCNPHPQVSHLVCMGSATHKSLICHLHGLCSQHKFYLSFTRALQPTFAVRIPGYIL